MCKFGCNNHLFFAWLNIPILEYKKLTYSTHLSRVTVTYSYVPPSLTIWHKSPVAWQGKRSYDRLKQFEEQYSDCHIYSRTRAQWKNEQLQHNWYHFIKSTFFSNKIKTKHQTRKSLEEPNHSFKSGLSWKHFINLSIIICCCTTSVEIPITTSLNV